jgi:hypothetical protein
VSELNRTQAALHAAMRGARSLDAVAQDLGADPARLGIYHRMVRGHVSTALRSQLTVCVESLGAAEETPEWQALFDAYYSDHPPSHWALLEAARGFRDFLLTQVGQHGVTPFHVGLAEFEWALYDISRDPARVPMAPPTGRWQLNPTLQVLEFPYPVVWFTAQWMRGERPALPDEAPEMALAFRRPRSGHPCFYTATPELLFALKMAHDGLSVGDAVTLSGQPREAVQAAFDRGVDIGLVIPAS